MELDIREPINLEELVEILKEKGMKINPSDISIRIENNIFSIDGKWLLRKKDGKLENINVLLKENEASKDTSFNQNGNFRSELRKSTENFEGRMDVDIKKLLYARLDSIDSSERKPCLTLSFLSILETGNSADIERWKDAGFIWQDIGMVDRTQLTPETSYTYGVIRQNQSEIQNVFKKYTRFDEKNFNKYFLYGMENRCDLLEGIMFYTNRDLKEKYVEFGKGEKFPTTEEKLETLKEETAKNYEQLYKFIYMLDREDTRFDCHLRPEEEEEVKKMAEGMLQHLLDEKIVVDRGRETQREVPALLFSRRAIFFNDRAKGQDRAFEEKKKGIQSKRTWGNARYDEIREYEWTEEVYSVLQQLKVMERTDPYQYYKRWLQAKIGRLKVSNQYPEEKINKLEEIYEKFFDMKLGIEEKNVEK